ncbi:hypothetical protein AGMMS49938_10530 [Fibrobacterales bacterium]|nr:hypothetical protein AGMMS49938_10530 [Fibrobacterales bacterium]
MAGASFALEIDAPPEIYNQVSAYSKEAASLEANSVNNPTNYILQVELKNKKASQKMKNEVVFELSLIDNGKVIKQVEKRVQGAVNTALQDAVFEILGKPQRNEKTENNFLTNWVKTVLGGAGITALWAVLYLTEKPKIVDTGLHYKVEGNL